MCRSMSKWTLLGILVFVLLALASAAFAGGGGKPEPGGGCPEAEIKDFRYDPPPYKGTITLLWEDNFVTFSGTVDKAGNSECVAYFPEGTPWDGMAEEDFINLVAHDLNGTCLIDLDDYFPFGCEAPGYYELLGAHKFNRVTDHVIIFDAMLMHVSER